jgi:hypothetical protein
MLPILVPKHGNKGYHLKDTSLQNGGGREAGRTLGFTWESGGGGCERQEPQLASGMKRNSGAGSMSTILCRDLS